MSETFFIKTTVFNATGDIADKNANSFIIGPGELNGPAGNARDSDLRLYGFGSLKWGEGVNQNLFRLLENNSCEPKVLGDWLPGGTQLLADYVPAQGLTPGNGEYNPTTDPILPKDENDLGIGNGITIPVKGQNWYNATNTLTYTFDGSIWKTVVNDDGSLSLTGLLDMGGFSITNIADPNNLQDAMTLNYADNNYVNAAGDNMTGTLSMGINNITTTYVPVNGVDVVNLQYADANYVNVAGDTMTGPLSVGGDLSVTGVTGFSNTPTVVGNDVWHAGNDGSGSGLDADTVDGLHSNELINLIYPIGSIYMSVNSTNPGSYPFFIGTSWVRYAEGRTIIGQQTSDPLFGTSGSTGGSNNAIVVSHSHTSSTIGNHSHFVASSNSAGIGTLSGSNTLTETGTSSTSSKYQLGGSATGASQGISSSSGSHSHTINSTGSSGTNQNLQPYIVTYMWERTG